MAIGGGRAHSCPAGGIGEGEAEGALFGDQLEGGRDQGLAEVAVVVTLALAAVFVFAVPAHVKRSYMKCRRNAAFAFVRV